MLHGIGFTIRKGERIGNAGTTGSGKSTLMNLLLGMLAPGEGAILIDGRRLDDALRGGWQSEIAHVPQAIYLTDDTLAANIAFGISSGDVDMGRIEEAAHSAEIGRSSRGFRRARRPRRASAASACRASSASAFGITRARFKRASVLVSRCRIERVVDRWGDASPA